MKYVKLRLPSVPGNLPGKTQVIESWHVVIDNLEDLFKYAKLDVELYTQAYLNTHKTSEGKFEVSHENDTRVQVVATMMNIRIAGTPEGQKIYPLVELADIMDKKTLAMAKLIDRVGAIRINEVGGYCGYDSFVETWNAEVLQTIVKDTVGFPIESDALNAKTLILENQRVSSTFKKEVEAITGDTAACIDALKEKDLTWVMKSIHNAHTIAFETQLQDMQQLDNFMELFTKLPRKRIIISLSEWRRPKLLGHHLWETNEARHEIILI